MKSSKIVSGVLVVAVIFAACQSVDFKKTSSGIPYKVFSSKKGDSVRTGTIVKYWVTQKVKDSVLYSSYKNKRPEYFQAQPVAEKATYTNIRITVEELILKSKEGDSLYLVQATDSLIKENPQQTLFKKGEQLVTTIKIEKVYKTPEEANADYLKDQAGMYEQNEKDMLASIKKDTAAQASIQKDSKIIEDYLKTHNIQAEKTEWGLYIERLTPGQGVKPKFGQFANVKYKGLNLSGQVFDEGVYPVQIGFAQVVPGFAQGVNMLSKGEKARVYIPSALAYGSQGSPPKIQPNEVLIFELELLDISDKQPEQQQPGQDPNK